MNSPARLEWILATALFGTFSARASLVNDGSTTTNLVQIANSSAFSQGSAVVHLDVVNSDAVLQAYQTGTSGDFFALRSAWYASELVATSGTYTVTADFQPASDYFANRGGVIGWLSLSSSNGIALQVTPEDIAAGQTIFRVSLIDFSANSASANDSLNHLFNKNGTAAENAFGSALSAAPNYSPTNFATFQLAFTAPTSADTTVLSNATAHIMGKVFQTNSSGASVQVGQTIELLTDLPLPAPAVHRFGYFAVWGSIQDSGDVIGYLDNLATTGGVGLPPNDLPMVSLTSPTNGATFAEPANITISANATDNDGSVTQVEFFAGTMSLGTATNAANNVFSLTWSNVLAGNYALTAQATDNRGGTSTSSPVTVTVSGTTGGGSTLTIVVTGNTIDISWPTNGYQLQMATNLVAPNWTDIAINTVNTNQVTLPITPGNMFFRLAPASAQGGPNLSIQLAGNNAMISWPSQASGYRLQANTNLLSTNWVNISSTNNQATEAIGGPAKFYRLISP